MLECLLEALLLGFGEIDEVLLDVAHTSLDVKLDSMDLLSGVLDVDLLLGWDKVLFKLSSSSLGSLGFFWELSTASADLVVVSLEAAILSHRLSRDSLVEVTAVAFVVLSVQAHSVLFVTEALAGLALGEHQSGTGLRILKLIKVGLLMPSRESWALLIEAFQTGA